MSKLTGPVPPMSRSVPPHLGDGAATGGLVRRAGVGPAAAAAMGRSWVSGPQPGHVAMLRLVDHAGKRPGEAEPGNPNVQGNYRTPIEELRIEATSRAPSNAKVAPENGPIMERLRVQQVLRALDEAGRLDPRGSVPGAVSGEVLGADDPMQDSADIIDITPRDPQS